MDGQSRIDQDAFKQFERAGYSTVAQAYDEGVAKVTSQANEAILGAVGAGPGIRLLDVACGPGWLSSAAARLGAQVTGLDLAETMLPIARTRCPEADIRHGDAESLPFESGRFDAVVCNFGILHLPDPERAIAEAFRVLASGGRYAFTCWTPPARNPFMALILDSVQAHGQLEVGLPPGPPLFRFGDPAVCRTALHAAGFASISVTEIPVMWRVPAPDAVMSMIVSGTARLGTMLSRQRAPDRERIERALVAGARRHATDRGIEIPSGAALAVGTRP